MKIKQELLLGKLPDHFDPETLFPPFNDNALQVVLQSSLCPKPKFLSTLVALGANVNHHNRLGRQPLHDAIGLGTEIIKVLLNDNAEINGTKHGDWTPLMLAAHKGILDEVQLLIHSGADCNLKNSAGFTAFHLACQCDHNDAVCLFLAKTSDIQTRAYNQRSALFTAVKHGNVDTVKLILSTCQTNVQTHEHGVSIFDNAMEGPGESRDAMLALLNTLQK